MRHGGWLGVAGALGVAGRGCRLLLQFLGLGLLEQDDAGLEGDLVGGNGFGKPEPFISAVRLRPGRQTEVAASDELDELGLQDAVGVEQARQRPLRKLCRRLASGQAPESLNAGGQLRSM